MVFPARRKVIFVHGCFWHRHHCAAGGKVPRTNLEYWLPKIERNCTRDKECQKKLGNLGWKILVIWECEVKNLDRLEQQVRRFLR